MEKYKDTLLFIFLPSLQKALFLKYFESIDKINQRDVFDAYMTPYFGAWINNQNRLGDKKFTQDYRLRFLKNQGATVDYVYDTFSKKRDLIHQFLDWLIRGSYQVQQKLALDDREPSGKLPKLMGRLVGLAGTMVYKIARRIYYDHRWARSILEFTNAQAVCFDYIMPRLYVVDAFLKAAREMSIPVLALPHGVQLYINEITKPKSTETRRFAKFNRFDHIIAPNK